MVYPSIIKTQISTRQSDGVLEIKKNPCKDFYSRLIHKAVSNIWHGVQVSQEYSVELVKKNTLFGAMYAIEKRINK